MSVTSHPSTTPTHLIDIVIQRLIRALRVLHLLDHIRVETEAESVLVVNQRLENEVQAFLDSLQLGDVSSVFKQICVRENGDGEGENVVR